ncbi:hypothetical protein AB1K56_03265 [Microbacterium sp. BWR-S6Y]|uniref:hypothetical protein n=1 Tax=Microbacterium sp. BWR-S6Y TaxID=3232073 RepID=UPI003527917C
MTRVALEASAFALPLTDIDPRHVAAAMSAGIEMHEDSGFVWGVQGMSALLLLRARAEVIVTLDAVDFALADTFLGWGIGTTDQPLRSMSEVACIIDCPPLRLTEAVALTALEAR